MKKLNEKYVAFLRGINVGGRHKVPMSALRNEMEKLNFENVLTLLNSGNIVFDAIDEDIEGLEKTISEHLEKVFGFPIPAIIRKSQTIYELLDNNPFKSIKLTKNIRLYVSFLRNETETELQLPWTSDDKSFKIIGINNKTILSVIDISISKTPKAMLVLARSFGTDITTRNWNTIQRIEKKL